MPKIVAGFILLALVVGAVITMIPDMLDNIERMSAARAEARKASLSCQDGDTLICTRLLNGDCVAWRVCVPSMPGFGQ